MDLGDRGDAAHRIGQRRLDVVLGRRIGLQMQQRGDDLQAVADAVVDFAQQHFAFGGERRIAVARGVNLGLGLVAGALQLGLPQRAVDGDLKQRNEIALHVLDQIVGGAGLQRSDGDRRDPATAVTNTTGGASGIAMIRSSVSRPSSPGMYWSSAIDVDAALRQPRRAPARRSAAWTTLKPGRVRPRSTSRASAGVVVDIQQCRRRWCHVAAGGT